MSRLALVLACALSVSPVAARDSDLSRTDAARALKEDITKLAVDVKSVAADLQAVRAIAEVKAVEVATIAAVAPRVEIPAPPVAPAAPPRTAPTLVPVVSTPAIRPDPVVLTPPPQVATPQALDQLVNNAHLEDASTAVIDGDAIVLGAGRKMGAMMTRAFDGADEDGMHAEVLVAEE